MKRLLLQFLGFAGVGVINTLTSVAVFEIFRRALPYLAAYTLAFGGGILASYVLNSKYVFQRPLGFGTALRFPFVYVLQYTLSMLLMHLLVEKTLLHPSIAMVLVVGCATPVSFLFARFLMRPRASPVGVRD